MRVIIIRATKSWIWTCRPERPCVANMDEKSDNDVRALFTQIGCILEDASVVALIWERTDAMTIEDRYQRLMLANRQISEALANIKSIIDAH